jgi:hypothetical protein
MVAVFAAPGQRWWILRYYFSRLLDVAVQV